ncbi:hypothetical protein M885DRAFT_544827 [Pelagophyceae sp. CCMP2097]|nr:hypothetical protein M885DRAFT_544827 [Pelagophyceae sp. CCMP2097]|mmetsp:Transcript_4175/g.13016  ORF Transcript_4175/g.13016 Transcript_4175/m.13016 type:complete len:312 (+) Transcript_4175:63-998(+)
MRLFVCGLGYTGLRSAEVFRAAFAERGVCVGGCVRSPEKQATLARSHPWLETFVLDLDDAYAGLGAGGEAFLAASTHVLQTVPPIADLDADPLLALHGAALRSGALEWVGYCSTTGVYGDHGGAWVDEDAALKSAAPKLVARVAAESAWRAFGAEAGVAVDVARLGGIYGPGRSMLDAPGLADVVAAGKGADRPVNRIHVDDIAGAIAAAAANPDAGGRTLNFVDDDPASRFDVAAEALRLLGDRASDGPGAARHTTRNPDAVRLVETKRVSNARLRNDVGYNLAAPTYREGLRRILEDVDTRRAAVDARR